MGIGGCGCGCPIPSSAQRTRGGGRITLSCLGGLRFPPRAYRFGARFGALRTAGSGRFGRFGFACLGPAPGFGSSFRARPVWAGRGGLVVPRRGALPTAGASGLGSPRPRCFLGSHRIVTHRRRRRPSRRAGLCDPAPPHRAESRFSQGKSARGTPRGDQRTTARWSRRIGTDAARALVCFEGDVSWQTPWALPPDRSPRVLP